MRTLGIIPARAGSVRIPRKNLERIGERTLVDIAWDAASKAGLDEIVVASDDRAMACGHPHYHIPPEIADGDISGCARHVLTHGGRCDGRGYDAVVVLQPAVPVRTGRTIRQMLDGMQRMRCRGALTGVPIVPHRWTWLNGRAVTPWGLGPYGRSQDITGPDRGLWQEVNSVQIADRETVLAGRRWDLPLLIHLLPPYAAIDIDAPEDLERARLILPAILEAMERDDGDGQRVVYQLGKEAAA